MVVLGESQKPGTKQTATREIERPGDLRGDETDRLDLPVGVRELGQIPDRKRFVLGIRDALLRAAIGDRERRPQGLVPRDQVVERTLQRLGVEGPVKPNRAALVVDGAAGIELIEEPQPFLRRGERAAARTGNRRELRPRAATNDRLPFEHLGKPGYRRLVEHDDRLERAVEGVLDSVHQHGGLQRATTQLEEVVEHAHPIEVERLRPQACKGLLDLRPRRDEGGRSFRTVAECNRRHPGEDLVGRARGRRDLREPPWKQAERLGRSARRHDRQVVGRRHIGAALRWVIAQGAPPCERRARKRPASARRVRRITRDLAQELKERPVLSESQRKGH